MSECRPCAESSLSKWYWDASRYKYSASENARIRAILHAIGKDLLSFVDQHDPARLEAYISSIVGFIGKFEGDSSAR